MDISLPATRKYAIWEKYAISSLLEAKSTPSLESNVASMCFDADRTENSSWNARTTGMEVCGENGHFVNIISCSIVVGGASGHELSLPTVYLS